MGNPNTTMCTTKADQKPKGFDWDFSYVEEPSQTEAALNEALEIISLFGTNKGYF